MKHFLVLSIFFFSITSQGTDFKYRKGELNFTAHNIFEGTNVLLTQNIEIRYTEESDPNLCYIFEDGNISKTHNIECYVDRYNNIEIDTPSLKQFVLEELYVTDLYHRFSRVVQRIINDDYKVCNGSHYSDFNCRLQYHTDLTEESFHLELSFSDEEVL